MAPKSPAGVRSRRSGRAGTMRAGDTHPGGLAGLGPPGPEMLIPGEHGALGLRGPGRVGALQSGMGSWVHGGAQAKGCC